MSDTPQDVEQEPAETGEPEGEGERLYNSCPSCSAQLDVTDLEPYGKMLCDSCGNTIRIRQQFDEFLIMDKLGEGGMSRVYRAYDTLLNRDVALKILNEEFSNDETRISQFEKEARITASISHPNVVKVFSVGRDQGFFYIAMELVGGGSLENDVKSGVPMEEDAVLSIAAQVSQGLRAAHNAGLIHRDIKPGNILFTVDGTAKIVDFGLSLIHGKEVDDSDEIWATPFYVPPEQLFDKPEDFRGDIYSLGASLFHVLAGKPPYDADTNSLEKLRKIKSKPVRLGPSAPAVSQKTREVIDRMIALDPENRFPNYDSLLEGISDARSILRNPAVRVAKRITSTRRQRAILVASFVGLFAILIAALIHFTSGVEDNDDDPPIDGPKIDGGTTTLGNGDRTVSEIFLDAREAMFESQYRRARQEFNLLLAPNANTIQPTRNWARFNSAVCSLMEADERVARFHFRALAKDSLFSDEESDQPLCRFFERVGNQLANDTLPEPISSTQFGDGGTGALGLLAAGLAHWQQGDPDHAMKFFDMFKAVVPGQDESWIRNYQALTKPFYHDYDLVRGFLFPLPDTLNIKEAQIAKGNLTAVLVSLQTRGTSRKLVSRRVRELDDLITKLKKEAEIAEAERLEKARKEEVNNFLALVRSVEVYRDTGQFTEARKTLETAEFQSPELQDALDDQIYLWQTGEEFLNQIVLDFNSGRYTGPIRRKSGTTIEGTITAASKDEIRVSIGVGETRIEMSDIPPSSLIEIANSIAESTAESPEYYRRQELLVVYARLSKEHELAKQFGDQLKLENADFAARWTRILEARPGQF